MKLSLKSGDQEAGGRMSVADNGEDYRRKRLPAMGKSE